jgi:hypothetical protein
VAVVVVVVVGVIVVVGMIVVPVVMCEFPYCMVKTNP